MDGAEETIGREVAVPGRNGERGFKALPESLEPEKCAFVMELRQHFIAGGLSLRAFGARYHYDFSSASRYLNAERLPERGFVEKVLDAVEVKAGAPVTDEARQNLYDLHERALEKFNPNMHRHLVLSEQLKAATVQVRSAELQVEILARELADKKDAYQTLRSRLRELETAQAEQYVRHGAELVEVRAENEQLQDELRRLRERIATLELLYEQAHARRVEAEERCERLEHSLAANEQEADREQREELRRAEERERLREEQEAELRGELADARIQAEQHAAQLADLQREAEEREEQRQREQEKLRRSVAEETRQAVLAELQQNFRAASISASASRKTEAEAARKAELDLEVEAVRTARAKAEEAVRKAEAEEAALRTPEAAAARKAQVEEAIRKAAAEAAPQTSDTRSPLGAEAGRVSIRIPGLPEPYRSGQSAAALRASNTPVPNYGSSGYLAPSTAQTARTYVTSVGSASGRTSNTARPPAGAAPASTRWSTTPMPVWRKAVSAAVCVVWTILVSALAWMLGGHGVHLLGAHIGVMGILLAFVLLFGVPTLGARTVWRYRTDGDAVLGCLLLVLVLGVLVLPASALLHWLAPATADHLVLERLAQAVIDLATGRWP